MPPRSRRPRRSRRRLLLAIAVTLTALTGATAGTLWLTSSSVDASDVPSRGVPVEAAMKPVRTDGTAVVQIMAHPDDDLFFMNPDTAQSIRSGNSLASVYLTAGESDGVNARRDDAHKPKPDKAAYAEARQNGIRAAYAEMATGNRTSPWDRTAIPTEGGGLAELDTLRAKPQISLVWVQLREAGSISGDRPHSLHGLWDGRIGSLDSQRAAGTPVRQDFSYTKEQVVDTVAGLLERFRPTFVRMQDPTPGRDAGSGKYADHQDHMYGARFAQAALARYAEVPGRPAFGVQNYLGYFTGGLPHTLDRKSFGEKLHTLKTYAWTDHTDYCEDPAGCGDRKVAARPAGHGWAQSVRYTRGSSTSWVQRGGDGSLWAFSVLDGRLAVWRKPVGAASAWSGPTMTAGTGLDAGVTSARLPDGRIAVFATRTTLGESAEQYRRDVVTSVQATVGGAFGPWRSLGTPERDDRTSTSDISAPAVTVDARGHVTVYVRDGRYRLTSTAQRADGGWSPWRSLGGHDIHGDPVAATDAHGRGYVFAATPKTVLAWTQRTPGGPLTGPVATGLPPTTLSLSVGPDGDEGDGVRLWFRAPGSGDVRSARFAGSGLASPVTELTGGVAGWGPVSGGEGLVAARSRSGGLATAQPGGAGKKPWTLSAPLFSGAPSGIGGGEAAGTGGVATIGLDGRLNWTPSRR
ncbi:PIG-L family deacetylase [Streptomyces purpureus]|uniref:PIG-L family deacetylase n=1 Tax=Streptomyces purpureus TaxID=1951 RepID=UPI0003A954C5|nr:PIG-L family deacetylase [Streptomyces purpureus]